MLHNPTLVQHKIWWCDTFYIPAVKPNSFITTWRLFWYHTQAFRYHIASCGANVEQYMRRSVKFLFPFSLEGAFVFGVFFSVSSERSEACVLHIYTSLIHLYNPCVSLLSAALSLMYLLQFVFLSSTFTAKNHLNPCPLPLFFVSKNHQTTCLKWPNA